MLLRNTFWANCLIEQAILPIRPGWGRALKPWWIGALASDRVKDDAATRPPEAVLDSARRQSRLAIEVSRRGLAAAGGLERAGAVTLNPLILAKAHRR
jgi:hypothetical protein